MTAETARVLQTAVDSMTDRTVNASSGLVVESEKPCFEIINSATREGIRIWANGRCEGAPEGTIIINRIPLLLIREAAALRDDED